MQHLALVNRVVALLSRVAAEVEGSNSAGNFDINRACELAYVETLSIVLDLPGLKNLNLAERANFPAVDLGDDDRRTAVQVTSIADARKVKETITRFCRHGLAERFDRLIIFSIVRTATARSSRKPNQNPNIDAPEIIDYRDIAQRVPSLQPSQVARIEYVLGSYFDGPRAFGNYSFNPLPGSEVLVSNLVPIGIPSTLFHAELSRDATAFKPIGRRDSTRNRIFECANRYGLTIGSDWVLYENRVWSFRALHEDDANWRGLLDVGTAEDLAAGEFFSATDDQESVFKSLLRQTVQQRLYENRVLWRHDEKIFIFLPLQDGDLVRQEVWSGSDGKTVFQRKLSTKEPGQTFICKHFAFSLAFVRAGDDWYAQISPDWFFSYLDYKKSRFHDQNVAWLKRNEHNAAVLTHLRFTTEWLARLTRSDLFAAPAANLLTFGELRAVQPHPFLPDKEWLPWKEKGEDAAPESLLGLFSE